MIKHFTGSLDEENRGIRLLYDGKKDKSPIELLSREGFTIKLPQNMFSKFHPNDYSFTTRALIDFLLSKGYKKILIFDLSCNILLNKEKKSIMSHCVVNISNYFILNIYKCLVMNKDLQAL